MNNDNSRFSFKFPLIRFVPIEEKHADNSRKVEVKDRGSFIFYDKENEWQQEYYVIYNSYLLEENRQTEQI